MSGPFDREAAGKDSLATPSLDFDARRVVEAYRAAIPFSYISEETQLRDAIEMLAARLDEGSATPDPVWDDIYGEDGTAGSATPDQGKGEPR